jgi:hypothetical protein
MYGYAFGAAEAGVEHVITNGIVRYPGEVSHVGEPPHILHYGIDFNIDATYNWNKMVYKKFDLFACTGHFFGPPPAGSGSKRHEAMRFVVNTLNHAFCDFYHQHCPGTDAALVSCPPTTRPPKKSCSDPGSCCEDDDNTCWQWALDNQCEENAPFMRTKCRLSCHLCSANPPSSVGHVVANRLEAKGAQDRTHSMLQVSTAASLPAPSTTTDREVATLQDLISHTSEPSALSESVDAIHSPQARAASPSIALPSHDALSADAVPSPSKQDSARGMESGRAPSSQGSALVMDEFRAIAEQHRELYGPGRVPEWLEHQVHGTQPPGATALSTSAKGPPKPAAVTAGNNVQNYMQGQRISEDGHWWFFACCVALWASLFVLVLARQFACKKVRRKRKWNVTRSDFMHR